MLSFTTEFPVSGAGTKQFVAAVRKWIAGSPHTKLAAQHLSDIPDEGRWKVESGNVSLEAILVKDDQGEVASFRYSAVDGNLVWITEATYSKTADDDWVGVRTDRQSNVPQVTLPAAKKPLIVRTLIDELGGGLDDELYVSDKAYFLKETDSRMAVRLLNADADNYLPIVYVSCPFPGQYTVDPVPLARVLGGLAHVIVEPSRAFSRTIQRDVESRNVYGGRVGVYWPDGSIHSYYFRESTPNEIDVRFAIVADVRAAHLNRRALDRCTWARAEARLARLAIEGLRSSGSGNVEEYVAAFDSELRAKNDQLAQADEEILRLKAQLRAAQAKIQGSSGGWRAGDEQELRTHEFDEVLKDALNRAAANEHPGSRRQHIIQAIVNQIPDSASLKDAKDRLKELLSQYSSMNQSIRKGLVELGFDIGEDGKHYKLTYMQDDRYTFALQKTGSDWRGGLNAVSDISKRVF